MSSIVKHETREGVTTITLAQPEKRNVLSCELLDALNAALEKVAADPGTRVALLMAEGSAFCAGMDLKSVALDDSVQASRFADSLALAYRQLLLFPVPLLCAVEGPALGGACGLVMAADLVFVGPKARFAFPETRVGVVPAFVSVVARRRLTPGKLMGLVLTGFELDARQSLELGLADFRDETSAQKQALDFARHLIAEKSDEAMRRTKAFMQSQFACDLERELSDAKQEFMAAVKTPAAARGLAAFRERKPLIWNQDPEA